MMHICFLLLMRFLCAVLLNSPCVFAFFNFPSLWRAGSGPSSFVRNGLSENFEPSALAQRVAELLRSNAAGGAQMEEALGRVNWILRIDSPCIDSHDLNTFLQFFVASLDFAVFPHSRRHAVGAPLHCDSKSGACG